VISEEFGAKKQRLQQQETGGGGGGFNVRFCWSQLSAASAPDYIFGIIRGNDQAASQWAAGYSYIASSV
jgi:hypothetical protein